MCGGSGGGTQYSEVTQVTSNLPEYAEPYYLDLMGRTGFETAQPYETFPGQRIAGFSPLEQEGMARIGALGISGTPPELDEAGRIAYGVGQQQDTGITALKPYEQYSAQRLSGAGRYDPVSRIPGYQAGQYDSGYTMGTGGKGGYGAGAGQYDVGYTPFRYDVGYAPGQRSVGFDPTQRGVGFDATQRGVGFEAAQRGVGFEATQRGVGFDPSRRDVDFEASRRDVGFDPTQRGVGFEPGVLSDADMLAKYADPYFQQVTDIEKREATRSADIRKKQAGLTAAGIGSLGGYREAIVQSEIERNLAQQVGDIQARGSQAAFSQAKQAFEADRAARAQREQFGQSQFGLNAEQRRAMEQFGQSQFGLNVAQLSEQERFMQSQFGLNVQQQQMMEQFGQSQFDLNAEQRRNLEQFGQSQFGLNAAQRENREQFSQSQFALNAEQQQVREQFMQSQFGQNAEQRKTHEQFMQSQFGQNEQGRQRAEELMQQGYSINEAAKQAKEEFMQASFGMNEQVKQAVEKLMQQGFSINEAARQAQEQFGQSQFGMNQQNQQFSAQMEMARYNAYESARQQAAQLGLSESEAEQRGQIAAANARMGFQQNQLGAAGMLGDFAGQRQGMEYDRIQRMMAAGQSQRNLAQQGLDMGYMDFMRQQGWGRDALSYLSAMLQGATIPPGQTTSSYGPQPSGATQAFGSGIQALGLAQALGMGGGG